ncbi:MAG: hypothetical protein ACKO8Z_15915 [Prosthecobacter sp.]
MKNALFALFLFSGLTASAATLRAGVATVDISPTEFPRIIAGGPSRREGRKARGGAEQRGAGFVVARRGVEFGAAAPGAGLCSC